MKELPIGPITIGVWIACLAFFVVLVNGLFKLSRNVKGRSPEPPNEVLNINHGELDRRVTAVEADVKDLKGETSQKIESLRLEMKADLTAQTTHFNTKFEALPERLINMLRNTGAIGRNRPD